MLGISKLLDEKPKALSGGQQQRVALGRAIVREPSVFLMDEPLSNLDAKLRSDMRTELQELQADLDVTTVYVTHDQTEAMAMGDRIAVMDGGVLQQVGPPEEVYRSPVNQFVADFIGSPSINLLSADVEGETLRGPGGFYVRTRRPGTDRRPRPRPRWRPPGGHHCRRFRPEHGRCDGRRADGERELPLHGDGRPRTHRPRRSLDPAGRGDTGLLRLPRSGPLLFDAQTGDALKTKTDNVDPAVVGATED